MVDQTMAYKILSDYYVMTITQYILLSHILTPPLLERLILNVLAQN